MKIAKLNLTIILVLFTLFLTQCGKQAQVLPESKTLGIVIYSNDVETVWNALRFANYSKSQGDSVNIFLLGKGVELDNLAKTEATIKEQSKSF